ncbi:MAG: TolC family protein [Saprospirales bacterium]|nr:MAG: TolC family protein [Saprospirales bacterium]
MIRIFIAIWIIACGALSAGAQNNNVKEPLELDFQEFLTRVLANNLDLAIEEFEIPISEAAAVAARVYEDPELEVILPAFAREDFRGMPRNIAFELEIPIETFGKRRYRIQGAEMEKQVAQAGLEDFLRFLRAEAAALYAELLVNQLIRERMGLTLEQLESLIEVNEARFETGEIGEIDLLQTRLEAKKFETEVFDLIADFAELNAELNYLMGSWESDSLVLEGTLEIPGPTDNIVTLIDRARTERPDVHLAERSRDLAEIDLKLARAERLPDFSFIAGYHNEEALKPAPGFGAVFAGLRIPLQFSGFNRGQVQMSSAMFEQSGAFVNAAKLEVEVEVREAHSRFRLAESKLALFTDQILSDAERVQDAALFSYQRGEVSLLEVLEAQRTLNEIYLNYYETLGQYAESLVDLSRATGIWLVEF